MTTQPELRESRVLAQWLGVLCVLAFLIALVWDVTHDGGFGTILRDVGLTVMAAGFCWMRWQRSVHDRDR
jgi:hypothetical protein